jgi:hypothetical protein
MKNCMWRKKNGAKEELPRIEPLTSRFPHSDLDLDFLARKFQIKVHKHCKTVPCAYSYHYILLKTLDGTVVFKTTDILSPNINSGLSNATPNERIMYLISRISSVATLEATNSDS